MGINKAYQQRPWELTSISISSTVINNVQKGREQAMHRDQREKALTPGCRRCRRSAIGCRCAPHTTPCHGHWQRHAANPAHCGHCVAIHVSMPRSGVSQVIGVDSMAFQLAHCMCVRSESPSLSCHSNALGLAATWSGALPSAGSAPGRRRRRPGICRTARTARPSRSTARRRR